MAKKKTSHAQVGATPVEHIPEPSIDFYHMKGEAPDIRVGKNVLAVVVGRVKVIRENDHERDGKTFTLEMTRKNVRFFTGQKMSEKQISKMDDDTLDKMIDNANLSD